MDNLTNRAEEVGEAVASAGVILGSVRAVWRRLFPPQPKPVASVSQDANGVAHVQLDLLSQRVDNLGEWKRSVDTKLDQISSAIAELTGEFRGYIRGLHDRDN